MLQITITRKQKNFLHAWQIALESGAYTPARGVLREAKRGGDNFEPTGEYGYCCIGVAAVIAGYPYEDEVGACLANGQGHHSGGNGASLDAGDWMELTGLPYNIQNMLIDINDNQGIVDGQQFNIISHIIGRLLGEVVVEG